MSTEIVRLTPSVIINGCNFSDECLCVYGHVNRPTLFKRTRCIECLHVLILKPNINWNFTIMVDEAHTLHQKAACLFVLQKLQYYDMMLLHGDSIPSLMSWSVLAVEDDRGLMGAPVTCLLLCLSCARPSGACDETMTAQSKEKLSPVNHKENPLWF